MPPDPLDDALFDFGAPALEPLLPEGMNLFDSITVYWEVMGETYAHSGVVVGVNKSCIKVDGDSYLTLAKDQIKKFVVTESINDNPFV